MEYEVRHSVVYEVLRQTHMLGIPIDRVPTSKNVHCGKGQKVVHRKIV